MVEENKHKKFYISPLLVFDLKMVLFNITPQLRAQIYPHPIIHYFDIKTHKKNVLNKALKGLIQYVTPPP